MFRGTLKGKINSQDKIPKKIRDGKECNSVIIKYVPINYCVF
jgi:hypothetical protein